MLAIRVPLFYTGIPIIIPELKWMLIGENLANGGIMYRNVWDFTGPLSSGIYTLLHLLFGKSLTAYRTLSIVLVVIQAFVFNNLLLKNKALNQNTYVPALMYMLSMHMSFDFFTLSPVLMGMTFILLGINYLFQRMDNTTRDDLFVRIGLFLGTATLFYLPFFLYFLITIFSLLIYTGSIFRRMLLMVYGFFLLITLCALYYFWFDSFSLLLIEYLFSIFQLKGFSYFSWQEFLGLTTVPLVVLIISIFKAKTLGRYINFQVKIQSVMLMFVVCGMLSIWITKEMSIYQTIFIVPGMAFFASHYLIALKRWIAGETVLLIFFALTMLNMLVPLKQWMFIDSFVSYENLIVGESDYDTLTQGRRVLVIGNNMSVYKESTLATPYLNWELSAAHLNNLHFYDNLTEVYQNFSEDLPEVIVDLENVIPVLFDKMPTIALQYVQHSTMGNVYLKKEIKPNQD